MDFHSFSVTKRTKTQSACLSPSSFHFCWFILGVSLSSLKEISHNKMNTSQDALDFLSTRINFCATATTATVACGTASVSFSASLDYMIVSASSAPSGQTKTLDFVHGSVQLFVAQYLQDCRKPPCPCNWGDYILCVSSCTEVSVEACGTIGGI